MPIVFNLNEVEGQSPIIREGLFLLHDRDSGELGLAQQSSLECHEVLQALIGEAAGEIPLSHPAKELKPDGRQDEGDNTVGPMGDRYIDSWLPCDLVDLESHAQPSWSAAGGKLRVAEHADL